MKGKLQEEMIILQYKMKLNKATSLLLIQLFKIWRLI